MVATMTCASVFSPREMANVPRMGHDSATQESSITALYHFTSRQLCFLARCTHCARDPVEYNAPPVVCGSRVPHPSLKLRRARIPALCRNGKVRQIGGTSPVVKQ